MLDSALGLQPLGNLLPWWLWSPLGEIVTPWGGDYRLGERSEYSPTHASGERL